MASRIQLINAFSKVHGINKMVVNKIRLFPCIIFSSLLCNYEHYYTYYYVCECTFESNYQPFSQNRCVIIPQSINICTDLEATLSRQFLNNNSSHQYVSQSSGTISPVINISPNVYWLRVFVACISVVTLLMVLFAVTDRSDLRMEDFIKNFQLKTD